MKVLVFDTETTGVEKDAKIVQIAATLSDEHGQTRKSINLIIRPDGYTIPEESSNVHGITTEVAEKFGVPASFALTVFFELYKMADIVVGHNVRFDFDKLANYSNDPTTAFKDDKPKYDTMEAYRDICKIPLTAAQQKFKNSGHPNAANIGDYKNPRLEEAYEFVFQEKMSNAHDAFWDVDATRQLFFWIEYLGPDAVRAEYEKGKFVY